MSKSGRRVLRNNTTHKDAVYIIAAHKINDTDYVVEGLWGKWETFIKSRTLQSKIYYSGSSMTRARGEVEDLLKSKLGKHYFRVSQYDTAMPWENSVTVEQAKQTAAAAPTLAPFTPKPKATPDPRLSTVAGLLELD